MIQNKTTFFLGIFIILVWIFFGIPTSWKIFLTIVSGLYLIFLSVKITLPKRGVQKRPRKKEKITPVFTENSPIVSAPEKQKIETASVSDESHTP